MILQGEREKRDHIYYEFDKTRAPIGVGGMGIVYQGVMVHELSGMTRNVAIKEVQTDADSTQRQALIDQAEREASIRLMNDNLVEMIDFVQIEEKRFNSVKKKYYVISELLHGVSLDKLLAGDYTDFEGKTVLYAQEIGKRYALDREDTAGLIVRNILSGVMALHDKGFLHRDIDPSNIMITDEGKIKILDFGIAKKHNRLSQEEDGLQREGAFVGKVEYAAPELINGDVSAQDFSTDIYSIGVVFYKLITGKLPFEGNRFEIIKGHQHRKPDLSGIKSAKYKAIIAKAMQKNPGRRYRSAAEMRVALDGADPLPVWGLGLMVAGLVAVLIFVAVAFMRPAPPTPEPEPEPVPDNTLVEEKVDTLHVFEILQSENSHELLASDDRNPAVLYAVAKDASLRGIDTPKTNFWDDVLVPQGDVDSCLVHSKTITSSRFAFVSASRAYLALDNYQYAPGVKEYLKHEIYALLESVQERSPDNYRMPNTDE